MTARRCAGLVLTVALFSAPTQAWAQAAAKYKASHDKDPHTAEPASVESWRRQKISMVPKRSGYTTASTGYASNSVALTQQAQQTYYYCGPAAVSEALGTRGITISQSSAAYLLRTSSDEGTAWSGVTARVPYTTGRPVVDVLNDRINRLWYISNALPYSPSSSDVSDYIDDMSFDIDKKQVDSRGWAVVGDAWEVPNGPHLTGHPSNREIFHWFAIYGYTSYGKTTLYADSVAGSGNSFSGSVPRYSALSSSTIVTILGGRGYVW
jgi:hypothetical protein